MNKLARFYPDLVICVLLVLLPAVIYLQVGAHEFSIYDDSEYVTENLTVNSGFTLEGFFWAFTTKQAGNWHPLTWLSHMLDCQLFGPSAGAHHLVNLFFHLANTVLLFLALQWMTEARWRSAFVAVLFALHPLHVESVAWIAERKDVLSTFFWFLTLMAYVHYTERPGGMRYLLVVLAFALGLMAKPMLVTLPLTLLLLDFWPLGRTPYWQKDDPFPQTIETERKRQKKKRKKSVKDERAAFPWPLAYEKIPLLVLTALSCLLTLHAQKYSMIPLERLPFYERVTNALFSYVRYILKMLWPLDLAPFYPHSPWPVWAVAAAAILISGVTILAIRKIRPLPYVAVGWFWYLGTLFPVIGIVQVGGQAMADRYTYVPLIGLFIILAWGIYDLAEKKHLRGIALAVPAGILIAVLMVMTWLQVQRWRDSVTLFSHAVAVTENNYKAHSLLAIALMFQGKLDEAYQHTKESLRIQPLSADLYIQNGNILLEMGKSEEAKENYRRAIQLDPNNASAHYNLGVVLHLDGNMERAIDEYQRAIKLRDTHFPAHMKLAEVLTEKRRLEDALRTYARAAALQPRTAEIYYNMGNILIAQGRLDEAVTQFDRAVRFKPDYARAHNNLGSTLLQQKKLDEAIAHFEEAVRLDPGYQLARENLNDALAMKKQDRR
jgi:tetratricopeptide (TPR) repeat protein